MEKLLKSIYQLTLDFQQAITEDRVIELDEMLNERNNLMGTVDKWWIENPSYQYSQSDKKLLEDIQSLDQKLIELLKEEMTNTKSSLNQIQKKKEFSKKYKPYFKQTDGVFLDQKK